MMALMKDEFEQKREAREQWANEASTSEVEITNALLESIELTSERQLEAALRFERVARALALASMAIVIPTLWVIIWVLLP